MKRIPLNNRESISKLKCPICIKDIGTEGDIVTTNMGEFTHFDCYISMLNEHDRR